MSRSNRYQYDQSFASDPDSPVRLWLLRLLVPLGGHKVFVRKDSFDSEHLAAMLGLQKWINSTSNLFDPNLVRANLRRLHAQAEKKVRRVVLPNALARNIGRLASMVELSDVDKQILIFTTFLKSDRLLDDTADWLGILSSIKVIQALAVLLNLPVNDVRAALSPRGTLAKTGLVIVDHRSTNTLRHKFDLLSESLPDHLMNSDEDELASLFRDVIVPAPAPTLSLADFSHIDRSLSILRPYLACALDTHRLGVNIYLHGLPGTGKTQLTRVIAQELGCDLLEVSGQDDSGNAVGGESRLRAYRFSQCLFSRRRALLLFDEVEDVFDDGDSMFGKKSVAQTRKAWINRALEENPVPTFWLSNSVNLDPAFLRRFDMVLELPVPPRAQRRRIMQESCGHLLSAESINRIAECEYLSPAVVTRAVSVVESVAGILPTEKMSDAIEHLIGNTLIAQGHLSLMKSYSLALPGTYDPSLINADADLAAIADGIGHNRAARLCLYGPPGTGKSAYGRWLAERLGIPLHLKRASELLSKYVGGTEKNLAKAFQVAEQDGALLLLDEVDSFLQDRRGAFHSWEITEVNEMLTQMESFSGVMIATTNLVKNLDQASLRRFDLKIKFDYLKAEHAWDLLCRHCAALGLEAPNDRLRSKLANLEMLTPGDFAVVSRQQRFRPASTPTDFINAIEAEQLTKEGAKQYVIGFV